MKTRVQAALRAIARADTPEKIAAEIAAAEAEAREAPPKRHAWPSWPANCSTMTRPRRGCASRARKIGAARRAEARIAELRERLAAARWQERDRAFRRHQRELAKLTRHLIDTMTVATEATAALARARKVAIAEVGNDISIAPPPFLGIPLPDLFASWRRRVEPQLEALAKASLPPPPPVPGAAPAPVQPVASRRGRPLPPYRNRRRLPRPRSPHQHRGHGSRFAIRRRGRASGKFTLPDIGMIGLKDGRQVTLGDRVNLPEDQARRILEPGAATTSNSIPRPSPNRRS